MPLSYCGKTLLLRLLCPHYHGDSKQSYPFKILFLIWQFALCKFLSTFRYQNNWLGTSKNTENEQLPLQPTRQHWEWLLTASALDYNIEFRIVLFPQVLVSLVTSPLTLFTTLHLKEETMWSHLSGKHPSWLHHSVGMFTWRVSVGHWVIWRLETEVRERLIQRFYQKRT